jgi:hypothetical protein
MSEMQQFIDRQAVRDLTERYFCGVDRKDRDLILSCFSEDAIYEFVVEQRLLQGAAEMSKVFGGSGGARVSSHALCNQSIMLDGDHSQADTFAVAHLVEGMAGPGRILVRGLRYLDDVVRGPRGWRIVHRRHHSLWQYEAASTSPDLRGCTAS